MQSEGSTLRTSQARIEPHHNRVMQYTWFRAPPVDHECHQAVQQDVAGVENHGVR